MILARRPADFAACVVCNLLAPFLALLHECGVVGAATRYDIDDAAFAAPLKYLPKFFLKVIVREDLYGLMWVVWIGIRDDSALMRLATSVPH